MEIIALKAFGGCFRLRIYFFRRARGFLLKTLRVMGLHSFYVILDSQLCFSNPVAVGDSTGWKIARFFFEWRTLEGTATPQNL